MATRFVFEGLDDLRNALRRLPADLRDDAAAIVEGHARHALEDVRVAYPQGPTGNLRRLLQVSRGQSGSFGVAVTVRSRAPHAWIFEKGTKPRHGRGRMPAGQVFVPTVIRRRGQMQQALVGLVRKAGLQVTA